MSRAIWIVLSVSGCGASHPAGDPLGPDADIDVDSDSDSDSDSDADLDTDSDSDSAPCVDGDLDGYCDGVDCDDADASVHPGAEEAADWRAEVVDGANSAGESCSIAVDADGATHLFYLAGNRPELERAEYRYATNAGGDWSIDRLEQTISSHHPTALAIDPDGGVHVAYLDSQDGFTLRYRTKIEGEWSLVIVERSGAYWEGISMLLQGDDVAHVAYHADPACARGACGGIVQLRYATNASGEWTTEAIDDSDYTGGAALALDSGGRLHVSYTAGDWDGEFVVRKAVQDAGAWSHELIAEGVRGEDTFWNGLCCTGLVLDGDGVAHVASLGEDVRYVTDASGAWTHEDLEEDGWDAYYVRLAPGPADSLWAAWVAYGRAGNFLDGEIHLARGDVVEGGGRRWTIETLDAIGMVDTDLSLAVGPDGAPHVVYVGATDDIVHKARVPIDDGIDQNCDGVP